MKYEKHEQIKVNNYIIALLLSAYTLNSYGMFKGNKTIIPHGKKKDTPSIADAIKDAQKTQQHNSEAIINRQIVLYHHTHNIKPPYPTPITRTFAETVIRQYEETMENE